MLIFKKFYVSVLPQSISYSQKILRMLPILVILFQS